MKFLTAAAALAGLSLAGSAQAAVNLVTNGSFEQGANGLSGWTVVTTGNPSAQGYSATVVMVTDGVGRPYPTGAFGDGVVADNAAGPFADAGTHAVYFSSDIGTQSLTQNINMTAGWYEVGFDAYVPMNGYNNPNDATFTASIGTYNWAPVLLKGTAIGANNWKHYSALVQVNPAQSNVPVSFTFTPQGYPAVDVLVDRVYVMAVPEPVTWALLVLGFGGAGAMLRSRRRRQNAAA